MTTLKMNLGERSYGITVGRGLLACVGEYFNLKRKVLVLTDSGVPREYASAVADAVRLAGGEPCTVTVPEGECSKSFDGLSSVCRAMLTYGFGRGDCLVAVGGGVVGDLGGFAASVYMRGIDFYNIPTTLLSQVDSSIGGKTAINLDGVKNVVGSFYQPKGVLVDIDVLSTLPKRQIASGMTEAVKMAITSDAELFSLIESEDIAAHLEDIIVGALRIKKQVVEEDEREAGLRKILNFGHTLGHGIEAECEMKGLFHGECVALGMIPMCAPEVRERVLPVLNKIGIDLSYEYNLDGALSFVSHDKKCRGGEIEYIVCERIGSCKIVKATLGEFESAVRAVLKN